MPTVRGGGQGPKSGYHTKEEIKRDEMPARARDDVDNAYAGDENEGLRKNRGDTVHHSTNVKGRKTEKSKHRTPIR
jgi:hypothetical protein